MYFILFLLQLWTYFESIHTIFSFFLYCSIGFSLMAKMFSIIKLYTIVN